jgi:hypothetical protein
MNRSIALTLIATTFCSSTVFASQDSIDTCIRAWKTSPFKVGATPDKTLSTSVRVLGIGQQQVNDQEETKKPQLIVIHPSVNVLGKTQMTLGNPNGWYCFASNVSVLGKIEINAHCKAHLASGKDGANVLGASDTNQGVTVLGSLRVSRFGCPETAETSKK